MSSEKTKSISGFLAVRLQRGEDVRQSIENWCRTENIDAAVLLCLVGSLETACIRMAGQEKPEVLQGPFEIVSCTGTIGKEGIHVHIAIADGAGQIIGGHLSHGSSVRTTIELTALDFSQDWQFRRVIDPATGAKDRANNNLRKFDVMYLNNGGFY